MFNGFYLPKKFSHIGVFGTTGCGKSLLCEALCEIENITNKKKIVDLTNNRFLEGVSWASPTRIPEFRMTLRKLREKYGNSFFEPKGFEVEIYHPLVASLPKKLPPNFKLYTLPIDFFAYDEVLRVLTNDSMSDAAMISLIQQIEKMRDSESFSTIPSKIMESVDRKAIKTKAFNEVPIYFFFDSSTSASSATRPLLKVKNLGIFSSRNFPYVLDNKTIKESLMNNKKITVFATNFISQRYHKIKLAINIYLLIKLRELVKGTHNTIVYIREARELFPNQRVSDRSLKVLSEQAESMAKDCRKAGISLLIDTQSAYDLPDGVLDQIGLQFIFRHDRKYSDLMEMYSNVKGLSKDNIKFIKSLPDHHFFVAGSNISFGMNDDDKGKKLAVKFSDHLERGEDELKLLKKIYRKSEWFPTKPVLDLLAQEWRGSSEKMSKKYEHFFKTEDEKSTARQIGIMFSELRVFKYFNRHKDTEWHTFSQIQRSSGMAFSTASSALSRMHDRGFLKRDETNKYYGLTESGHEFIKDHKDVFE